MPQCWARACMGPATKATPWWIAKSTTPSQASGCRSRSADGSMAVSINISLPTGPFTEASMCEEFLVPLRQGFAARLASGPASSLSQVGRSLPHAGSYLHQ